MQLSEQQFIPAPPAEVYAALNDRDILAKCIPGCETLEKKSDTELAAKITLKVGPVKATFTGEVTLSNLNPPHGYTISGKGSAGAAGSAQGGADVSLQAHNGGTMLAYKVNVQISGKIAQLGARLIDSTAKKLAAQFFANFAECLAPAGDDNNAKPDAPVAKTKTQTSGSGNKTIIIIAIAATAALLIFALAIS